MSAARTGVMAAVAGALLAGGVWWTYDNRFAGTIRDSREEIAAARRAIGSGELHTREHRGTRAALRALAARTLGPDAETVRDHLLARLNAAAREAGLSGVRVSTSGRARAVTNPGAAESRSTFRSREMRGRPDFFVLEGDLAGEGTYASALRAVALVESQPWLKRVTAVTIDPKDQGRRVELRVRLETPFLPGFSPEEPMAAAGVDAGREALLAELVARDAMTAPPPPAPSNPEPVRVAQADPKPPGPKPPPPPPPYHLWLVTGWVSDAGGVEVWARHSKSGNSRTLRPGGKLHGAVFHGVEGGMAIFEIEGHRYALREGETLGMRDRRVDPE